jgi:hypothetical protein
MSRKNAVSTKINSLHWRVLCMRLVEIEREFAAQFQAIFSGLSFRFPQRLYHLSGDV